MKRLLALLLCLPLLFALASCSSAKKDKEALCKNAWISSVDVLTFTESGKVLTGLETEDTAVSFYKIKSGGKILLFTEEGEEYGVELTYKFKDGNLYLGDAEYTPLVLAAADGETNKENGAS